MQNTIYDQTRSTLFFEAPVDFSNIDTNKNGQRMLEKLKGKTKQEALRIVQANMQVMADEGARMDMLKLDYALRSPSGDTGYLNSPAKIEYFWRETAASNSEEAVTWMEKRGLL